MFRSVLDILDALFPARRTRRRGQSAGRRRTARLALDAMEERWVPAVAAVTVPIGEPDPYAVGDSPQAVVTADFNGDGRLDLAVANFVSNSVSILQGAGDGTFGAAIDYAVGSNPSSLAVGDLDGDGDLDLVVANSGGTDVSVLLGTGTGSFGTAQSVSLQAGSGSANPQSVATGDFNKDGKFDVAVTSQSLQTYEYYDPYYGSWYSYTVQEGQLSVLTSDGSGGFSSQTEYSLGDRLPSSVTLADVNADGKLDAITTNENNGTVSVLLGQTGGALGTATDYRSGWYPQALAVGDFTGDGKPDLVAVGQTVDVLPGFGDGTFQSVRPVYIDPVAVATGDFNGDGKLDVITADPNAGANVLLGRGDGTFALPIDAGAGASPMAVAVGDFNRDGKIDAVVANAGSDNLSVLLNDGQWPALNAPSLSVNDVTVTEGNDGTVNATFTISLSAAAATDITVRYAAADGLYYWSAAQVGSDFQATSGTATIRAGQTSTTVSVPVIGDLAGEYDEAFVLKLSGATNAFIADNTGVGTILDNEPRITIESSGYVTEGNLDTTAVTFTVRLSAPAEQEVTVNFSTAEGDLGSWNYYDYYGNYYPPAAATVGTDFEGQSGTLTFAKGESVKTITVQVKGDRSAEDDEVFSVSLDNASGAVIETSFAPVTIGDDEPWVSLGNATIVEGSAGTAYAVFTATLSRAYDAPVTAAFATGDLYWYSANNRATAGVDYEAATGTVTFNPGATTATIAVKITTDRVAEYTEYFALNLSNATNAHISYGTATATITDDDAHVGVTDVSLREGASGAVTYYTFTVSLSAPSDSTVTVKYATSDGGARAGEDYQATSGTLTFAPGETTKTVTVAVYGDATKENDEYFYLNLSTVTGNAVIYDTLGLGLILNDDADTGGSNGKGNGKKR